MLIPLCACHHQKTTFFFFNRMFARCTYCLLKNNKRIGVMKKYREREREKKIEVASKLQCRHGQELDTYSEGELNTQTDRKKKKRERERERRERKKAKSNFESFSSLRLCIVLNRTAWSVAMIYIKLDNRNR